MKIAEYSFGEIVIDGQRYTSDVLLCNGELKSNWWREEGHSLCMEDLDWVLKKNPDILIIGTGKSGIMKVPTGVKHKLKDRGIEVIDQTTGQAVETFNQKVGGSQVVAAGFHLTC